MRRLWLLWQILWYGGIRVHHTKYRSHFKRDGVDIFLKRSGEEFCVFSLRTRR